MKEQEFRLNQKAKGISLDGVVGVACDMHDNLHVLFTWMWGMRYSAAWPLVLGGMHTAPILTL